jgi:serine/threonine-protein kinase
VRTQDELCPLQAQVVRDGATARLTGLLATPGEDEEVIRVRLCGAVQSASRAVRTTGGDRRLLRSVGLVQGALFLGIVGAGTALQYGAGRLEGARGDAVAVAGAPVEPRLAGHVRFVVDPWADVFIDGQHVLTTPSARAVPLAPGRHYLKLKNTFFAEVDRELRVVTGQTEVVDVTLEPLAGTPQRPAAPGAAP